MQVKEIHVKNKRSQVFAELLHESIKQGKGCCSSLSVEVGANCEVLVRDDTFRDYIVEELIANCAEKKDREDIDIGVLLTHDRASGLDRLVLEDNVCYSPAVLKKRLARLARKKTACEGKDAWRKSKGGLGKVTAQSILARWGGTLTFLQNPV